MQPAPEAIVGKLVAAGALTENEARLGRRVPMAHEVCVEADSGGHTDRGVALTLVPVMLALREEMQERFQYSEPICVGAAGGIGTPHAAAAAFAMGVDFILTGSINQCTVEAGVSAAAKDLLQKLDVQDTAHAPAGDMFELGAKVQVVKRGVLFPGRANRLYELYQRYASLEEIDEKTRQQIEQTYFRRTFADVWNETRAYYAKANPAKLAEAEKSPRQKMALVFRWYFVHSARLAMAGSEEQKVDYQVQCGPAMGAFNRWVRGTDMEPWRNRRVAEIAERLMRGAAIHMQSTMAAAINRSAAGVSERSKATPDTIEAVG
jgi:trans-AT polyketide synthase/acyltransferase/oxidoreductase domain-containing protein